jgi:lipoyl(octanoyl) transferase
MPEPCITVRRRGCCDYQQVWQAMRSFTAARSQETPDEIWLVEHPPVFTLGQAGRREHLLAPGEIPVVQVDRGGQVTYHGPGQLVVYTLLDLGRQGWGVRWLVEALEQSVIDLLQEAGIAAVRRPGAPGVFVAGKKIASLGLRIRQGRCYHGLALNVAMDLTPFQRIHPCGYPGLEVAQLRELGIGWGVEETGERLLDCLLSVLGHAQGGPRARPAAGTCRLQAL